MSRVSDEPDFGEVKGLLRRLETSVRASEAAPGQAHHPYAGEAARPARHQQGLSAAAALFLVANTVMTTATVTSIAWYLFHTAEMQRSGRAGAGPAGGLLGTIQWPPRGDAAPAAPPPVVPQQPAAAAPSVASEAAVTTARLTGPERLEIGPGQASRVPLQLEPREAIAAADHLSVRGVPGEVSFNRGARSAPDAWSVPFGAVPELELIAAAGAPQGRFDVVFTARTQQGRELASARSQLVIATMTAAIPAPAAPVDEAAIAKQIAKAREFLGIGQVGAARLVLQRAADSGSAEAALLLGDTYDPVRLFQLGARGLVGDMEKATFWYGRADELGSPEAKARIIGLRK